jgi:hypothetical protein
MGVPNTVAAAGSVLAGGATLGFVARFPAGNPLPPVVRVMKYAAITLSAAISKTFVILRTARRRRI